MTMFTPDPAENGVGRRTAGISNDESKKVGNARWTRLGPPTWPRPPD
jgi:hypothetical protein